MSDDKKSKLLSTGKTSVGLMAWLASIMAIFTPLISEYGTWLALLLAAIHGLLGGIFLPVATILTCLANIFLLSPLSSMNLSSILVTSVLMLAAGFSVKHAIKSRFLG